MSALVEVINYLQDFLACKNSTDEVWEFSYDLPHFISLRIDEIEQHNKRAAVFLNDEVIDWCAALDYEDSADGISEETFLGYLHKVVKQLQDANQT